MNDLQRVALGEESADLVIQGGRVLTADAREFREADVAIVDGRIAAVTGDAAPVIGPDTRRIDAGGRAVVPGFIDAHAHLDQHQSIGTAYHRILAGGTTTVVDMVSKLGAAFGAEGVRAVLEVTADLPIDFRATVPPQPLVEMFTERRADEAETGALLDLLARDRVAGVSESCWIYLLDDDLDRLCARAHDEGKVVIAHGAGCRGEKLTALAAVADNDHEPVSGDQVVERADAGIHPIGRYGSTRDDVGAVADAHDRGVERISLGTDGMEPRMLVGEGYLDAVVRRAIEEGIDPVDAIRMATLETAEHFGFARKGRIAPGADADLAILDDLGAVEVGTVVSEGEVVVRGGEPVVGPRGPDYPDAFEDSIPDADPSFRVPAAAAPEGEVRALRHDRGLVTREATVEPRVEGGDLRPDPAAGVLKAALIDRRADGERSFTGFATGYGLEAGAVATSLSVEIPGTVVLGADEAAMADAYERVRELGGGWVAVRDGGVIAELPLPVGAVWTDEPVERTAERYDEFESTVREMGMDIGRPLFALQCLAHPGVPAIRLTYSGYADVIGREVVGLAPE